MKQENSPIGLILIKEKLKIMYKEEKMKKGKNTMLTDVTNCSYLLHDFSSFYVLPKQTPS
jgi:hypothetical protein